MYFTGWSVNSTDVQVTDTTDWQAKSQLTDWLTDYYETETVKKTAFCLIHFWLQRLLLNGGKGYNNVRNVTL